MGVPRKGRGWLGPLQHDGPNVTRLGTLGSHRWPAVTTVAGPMATAVLRAYVTQGLGPTLTPGDIVVLDNNPILWG
jgi:hypothetical protein